MLIKICSIIHSGGGSQTGVDGQSRRREGARNPAGGLGWYMSSCGMEAQLLETPLGWDIAYLNEPARLCWNTPNTDTVERSVRPSYDPALDASELGIVT